MKKVCLFRVCLYRPRAQRENKNVTSTFHSEKPCALQAKILPEHSESHSLINKAVLSIKACVSEKHIIFSGHYTPLSCTVAVLPPPLGFPISGEG